MKYAAIFEKNGHRLQRLYSRLAGVHPRWGSVRGNIKPSSLGRRTDFETMRDDGDPIREPTTIADYIAIPA
jgi:hypothetical protein